MAGFSVFESLRRRLGNSATLTRFFSAASWSVVGSVVANGASLVMTMIVARALGKDSFGHYIALQTTITTIAIFSWFGLGFAANRYAAKLARRDNVRLGRILGLLRLVVAIASVIVVVGLVLAAGAIAQRAFHAPELATPIMIVAAAIPFLSFDGFQKNILIGMSELRAFALSSMLGAAAAIPVMIALTHAYGLTGSAVAIVFGAIANCAISFIWSRNSMKMLNIVPVLRGAAAETDTLVHFALPALLTGLLPALANWIVQSLLARTENAGEVAVFGIAMQWFHLVNFLPATLARALMPILTDSVADRDHNASRNALLAGVASSTLVALPMSLAGTLLSPYIMASYGPEFAGAHGALTIALGVAVLHAAQNSVQQLIAARNHMWIAIAMTAAMTAVFVGLSATFSQYGAQGAVVALAIAYVVQAVASMAYVLTFMKVATRR